MISGKRIEVCVIGSFVLPTVDGNYAVPPATVIETFWGYKRTGCELCSGVKSVSYGSELGWTETCPRCQGNGYTIVANDDDMVLKYKLVDPVSFNIIPFLDGAVAKDVTLQMIVQWVSTKQHPHFIGGQM